MQIRFAARTDVGKTREHNEDNFLVDKKLKLFVVADGMGGHACGEVASAMAVNIVRENVVKNSDIIEEYREGGGAVARRDILALLEHSIQHACNRIYMKGLESPRQRGMGTTLTAMLIVGGRGFLGHVGDSRLYLVRDSSVHQLTEDHSLLNELLKHGKVKSLGDIDHRFKNAVTRAVGVYESVEVDTLDFDILPKDRFLLCSDGLHGYLDSAIITERMAETDLETIVGGLTDFANDQGGKDNITSVVVLADEEQEGSFDDVRLRFDTLKRLRLFRYLNYKELVRVMNICSEARFGPGETLFREGDQEDRLYILLKGDVVIEKSGVEMARLAPGVHFGEMALVDQTNRSADARTHEGCTVLAMERRDFYDLMRKNSTLAVKMLWSFVKALTERLRNANGEITKLKSSADAPETGGVEWMSTWVSATPMLELSPMAPPPMPTDAASIREEFPPELLPLGDIRGPQPVTSPSPDDGASPDGFEDTPIPGPNPMGAAEDGSNANDAGAASAGDPSTSSESEANS